MKRKRNLILLAVMALLAVLFYVQVHAWRRFDWQKFAEGTEGIAWFRVLLAVAVIYAADFLRAIRWKIFLRPTAPRVNWTSLIAPQYVGFTGLALLGRPGEFIRPYLIARRQNLTFSSQVAIWFVERAFDIGAVAVLLAVDIFALPSMREAYPEARIFGYVLIALCVGFVVVLWLLWKRGPALAAWCCRQVTWLSRDFANRTEHKMRAITEGLNTIHDRGSFIQASVLSLVIWLLVALAYRTVTHAFPADTGLPSLDVPEVLLLMGASVAGGVMQLPVVGGGSQLATIFVLSTTFGYQDSPELAVACGMLLWLVTFMSVIPLGLLLARYEHVSLRRLTEESQEADRTAAAQEASGERLSP